MHLPDTTGTAAANGTRLASAAAQHHWQVLKDCSCSADKRWWYVQGRTCGSCQSKIACQRAKKPFAMSKLVLMISRQRCVRIGVARTAARPSTCTPTKHTWQLDIGLTLLQQHAHATSAKNFARRHDKQHQCHAAVQQAPACAPHR